MRTLVWLPWDILVSKADENIRTTCLSLLLTPLSRDKVSTLLWDTRALESLSPRGLHTSHPEPRVKSNFFPPTILLFHPQCLNTAFSSPPNTSSLPCTHPSRDKTNLYPSPKAPFNCEVLGRRGRGVVGTDLSTHLVNVTLRLNCGSRCPR